MKKRFAAVFLFVTGIAVADEGTTPLPETGPLPEATDSDIGYSTLKEAITDLSKKPGVTVREEQGWTIIDEPGGAHKVILWSFTPEGHPAYPSMVKRTLYEQENGRWLMRMNIRCGAAKAPCDELVRDFEKLNGAMKNYIRDRKK
jgi:hypothetical protein